MRNSKVAYHRLRIYHQHLKNIDDIVTLFGCEIIIPSDVKFNGYNDITEHGVKL